MIGGRRGKALATVEDAADALLDEDEDAAEFDGAGACCLTLFVFVPRLGVGAGALIVVFAAALLIAFVPFRL